MLRAGCCAGATSAYQAERGGALASAAAAASLGPMGRSAWAAAACTAFVALATTQGHAQTVVQPLLVAPSLAPLPKVPELRLSWPMRPLQVTYTESEVTGYVAPLQLFRLESLWLQTPRFQLLSATTAERAFELDCRLTCQPVVNRAVELEARLKLPGASAAVPSTYVSLRSSAGYTSQAPRAAGLLRAAFGGFLDF